MYIITILITTLNRVFSRQNIPAAIMTLGVAAQCGRCQGDALVLSPFSARMATAQKNTHGGPAGKAADDTWWR